MDMAELEKLFFDRLSSMTDGEIVQLLEKAEPCGLLNTKAVQYVESKLNTTKVYKSSLTSQFRVSDFIVSGIESNKPRISLSNKRIFISPRLPMNFFSDAASFDAACSIAA